MRLKLKIATFLLIFASAMALARVKPAYSVSARLRIDPPIAFVSPGEAFNVSLHVDDAAYLYSWQANITFDPSVIEFVNVTEGEYLKDQPEGTSSASRIDHATDGWVLVGWTSVGGYQGISGSGILANIEFRVLTDGESKIYIQTEPVWFDLNENGIVDEGELMSVTKLISQSSPVPPATWGTIAFTAVNGLVFNLETPPNADFTYSPGLPGINQTVTFDATASSATPPRSIIEYDWDFGDGTNGTGQIVEHAFTTGGTYTVSLIVTDDAPATALVQEMFNTTVMPRIWYESYSKKEVDIGVTFISDIEVTSVVPSKDEVTSGEITSIDVTVRNNGLTPESFNVTAYYGQNTIETKPVTAMSNGTEQTLSFEWDTTGVPEGSYQISAEVTDVEADGNPENNELINGNVLILAAQPFPTNLVVGIVAVVVVLAIAMFWLLRKRGS